MRAAPNALVERFRLTAGAMASISADGNNGGFLIPHGRCVLQVIVSDSMGWDHVSVVPVDRHGRPLYRTPTWDEMCFVKRLFFSDDEAAVEYHPPRAVYRNAHPYVLHLWRPQLADVPMPDPEMVAPARAV